MQKFKIGDLIIGNKKANGKYGITVENWRGEVISVDVDGNKMVAKDLYKELSFPLNVECFDLCDIDGNRILDSNYVPPPKPDFSMFKPGTAVIFKQDMKGKCGISEPMKCYSKNKIWGKVSSINEGRSTTTNGAHLVVIFNVKSYNESFTTYSEDIEIIDKKDYEKYAKIEKEFQDLMFPSLGKTNTFLTEEKEGNYKTFDFDRIKITYFNDVDMYNRLVYVKTGKIDWRTNEKLFVCENIKISQDCCDFIKNTRDFEYYIPIFYLNYYGYSVEDVQLWFNFLNNLDINFKGIFNGHTLCTELAKNKANEKYKICGNTIYSTENTEYIKITVKAGDYSWHTYLFLLLLRYMHHQYYYWIPALAMQIKDAVEECTHWEALLMAHFSSYYHNGQNGLLELYDKKERFINIATKQENVLEKLKTEGMNNSFNYANPNKCDYNTCQKLVDEKQFKQLYNYLKTGKI